MAMFYKASHVRLSNMCIVPIKVLRQRMNILCTLEIFLAGSIQMTTRKTKGQAQRIPATQMGAQTKAAAAVVEEAGKELRSATNRI